jgi:hypothetical protein
MIKIHHHASSRKIFIISNIEHLVALRAHEPNQKVDYLPRSAGEQALDKGIIV